MRTVEHYDGDPEEHERLSALLDRSTDPRYPAKMRKRGWGAYNVWLITGRPFLVIPRITVRVRKRKSFSFAWLLWMGGAVRRKGA